MAKSTSTLKPRDTTNAKRTASAAGGAPTAPARRGNASAPASSARRTPGAAPAGATTKTPGSSAPSAEAEAVRAPQQDRGHRRVESILDAAESIFAEVGVDAATTNAIAERAGASMGSLYHFFPGKDAIVMAVAGRFAERIRERNAQAVSLELLHAPLPQLFDRIIGTHASFVHETPAFAVVEEAMNRKYGGCAIQTDLNEAIIDQVRRFIEARLPRLNPVRRLAATRLSVVTVGVTVERAATLPAAEREPFFREVRDMLVRYFEPLDRDYGHPRR